MTGRCRRCSRAGREVRRAPRCACARSGRPGTSGARRRPGARAGRSPGRERWPPGAGWRCCCAAARPRTALDGALEVALHQLVRLLLRARHLQDVDELDLAALLLLPLGALRHHRVQRRAELGQLVGAAHAPAVRWAVRRRWPSRSRRSAGRGARRCGCSSSTTTSPASSDSTTLALSRLAGRAPVALGLLPGQLRLALLELAQPVGGLGEGREDRDGARGEGGLRAAVAAGAVTRYAPVRRSCAKRPSPAVDVVELAPGACVVPHEDVQLAHGRVGAGDELVVDLGVEHGVGPEVRRAACRRAAFSISCSASASSDRLEIVRRCSAYIRSPSASVRWRPWYPIPATASRAVTSTPTATVNFAPTRRPRGRRGRRDGMPVGIGRCAAHLERRTVLAGRRYGPGGTGRAAWRRPAGPHPRRQERSRRWPTAWPSRPARTCCSTRDNPVDWWEWSPGGLRGGRAARRPGAAVDRLRRLPLVPRHGARVVRGRDDRGVHERALRQRQGRPRGAARRRRRLHGGRPGDDRPRRLADDELPHREGRAVLLRHLLAAERRRRHAGVPRGAAVGRADLGRPAAARSRRPAPTSCSGCPARPAGPPPTITPELLDRGGRVAARRPTTACTAASAAPRSSRRRWCSSSCCGTRPARARASTSSSTPAGRWPAAGCTTSSPAASPGTPSTPQWVVPHFEKMLYDNALLLRVYVHLWRATGSADARRVALETADFLLRDLRTAQGGFASALDADTDGEEGLTYVWTPAQLVDVLGDDDGRWAAEQFDVTATGTFEHGASVLQRLAEPDDPERYARVCAPAARGARAARPQPGRDDKVVGGLERPRDRRARRGRRRCSTGPTAWPPPPPAPTCCATLHTRRRAAAAHVDRRTGRPARRRARGLRRRRGGTAGAVRGDRRR